MISSLGRLILSAGSGVLAGAVSLLVLSALHWLTSSPDASIVMQRFYVNEIVEELAKFFALLVFFDIFLHKENGIKLFSIIAFSAFFGIGFGIFEGALIFLSGIEWINFLSGQFIFLSIVHMITSILIGIAAAFLIFKKSFIFAYFLVIFAIFLHIYYNIFALNFS